MTRSILSVAASLALAPVVGASVGNAQGWKWTFLGGTGKWTGIQCGGTGKSVARYARLSPAVTAGCGLAVGTYSFKK